MRTVHFLGITSLLLAIPAVADANFGGVSGASASYLASGPAGLELKGSTSDVRVADDGANITITVGVATMKGSIEKRDEHFRKTLETDSHKEATLKVAKASLKLDGSSAQGNGTLKLHGVEKPYSFSYKAAKDGDGYKVSGDITANTANHGITIPSYLGVTVKPIVPVHVEFRVKGD